MSETPIEMSPEGTMKRRSWVRVLLQAVLLAVLAVVVVQLVYAEKYQAVVNVIAENRIGVNPTGERLDFGDLPKSKGATRAVTLESAGDRSAYVMVWYFGGISDLLKVSRNYFYLEPGKKEKLEFSVYVPESAEVRQYTGRVLIFKVPRVW